MPRKETNVINLNDFQIEVGVKHKRDLREKYNCSAQAVRDALNYVSNSEKAVSIREDAKEMLKMEIEKLDKVKVTSYRKSK